MIQDQDKKFISYALNLAKKNLGKTVPNPVVGCIIVKNGEIISCGITAKGGRPHAEKIAIEKISDKKILHGATLYVTLEPCAHFGQTEPCADLIIANKFAKVVIATQDPDGRVDGKGIEKLRQAGIEVICGVLEKEAQEINRGFFTAKKTGLPFVTLKLATSLDGKIATKSFDSRWITSEKARQFSHLLRAKNDGILVGAGTVRIDNPALDCRILGLEDSSPKKIILSNKNDFDPQANIFRDSAPIIIGGELKKVLQKLREDGINSLLVEGGQKTSTEFLKENLVDELVWIRNKKIIGNDGISAIGELGFTKISEALSNFSRHQLIEMEDDLIEIYRR